MKIVIQNTDNECATEWSFESEIGTYCMFLKMFKPLGYVPKCHYLKKQEIILAYLNEAQIDKMLNYIEITPEIHNHGTEMFYKEIGFLKECKELEV